MFDVHVMRNFSDKYGLIHQSNNRKSMLHVHAMLNCLGFQAHAPCPCFMSMLYTNVPWVFFMSCCMSMLHFPLTFLCYMNIKIKIKMYMKINIKMHPESGTDTDMDTDIGLLQK